MAKPPGRPENLIQNQPGGLTPERARANGRKGGLASGIARQRRRAMRETLSTLLQAPIDDEKIAAALQAIGLPADYQGAMTLAVMRKALLGDVEAARYLRDTAGEKPTETYNLSMEAKPVQALDLSKYSDAELEQIADGLPDED